MKSILDLKSDYKLINVNDEVRNALKLLGFLEYLNVEWFRNEKHIKWGPLLLKFEYEGYNTEYNCYYKQYGDSGWITVKVFLNDGMKGFSIEFEDCLFSYYLGKYKYVGIDNTKYYNLPLIKSPEEALQKNKIIDLIKNSTYKSDIPNYYLDFILKKVAEYESTEVTNSKVKERKHCPHCGKKSSTEIAFAPLVQAIWKMFKM